MKRAKQISISCLVALLMASGAYASNDCINSDLETCSTSNTSKEGSFGLVIGGLTINVPLYNVASTRLDFQKDHHFFLITPPSKVGVYYDFFLRGLGISKNKLNDDMFAARFVEEELRYVGFDLVRFGWTDNGTGQYSATLTGPALGRFQNYWIGLSKSQRATFFGGSVEFYTPASDGQFDPIDPEQIGALVKGNVLVIAYSAKG